MEDEPFDSLGRNGIPPPELRKSSPRVPPSAAFAHSSKPAVTVTTPQEEDEPKTSPVPPAAVSPEENLPARWKQYDYETKMENHRSESNLAVTRSVASAQEREATRRYLQEKRVQEEGNKAVTTTPGTQEPYANYRLSKSTSTNASGVPPRQPYSFNRSESYDTARSGYDTADLIRKYGSLTGVPPVVSSRPTPPSALAKPEHIRDEAMKVLDLVDDHLKTPLDVRRTQSGGFRAAPTTEPYSVCRTDSGAIVVDEETPDGQPYAVQRTASGTISSGPGSNAGGRRVPAALSGINFSSSKDTSWRPGRYSFTDPSFRDDDNISEEEDEIIMSKGQIIRVPEDNDTFVDIAKLENRSAGSRSNGNRKKFDGDFPQPPPPQTTWSSRYSDTYATQKNLLNQWDGEFEKDRQGAQKMFMSTANNVRSAAGNVLSAAESQSSRVFGSGFSFRQNHVYGNHSAGKPDVNLRTVWKDVSEDDTIHGPPRVHKTWQEALLNKRKRRNIIAFTALLLLAIIMVVTTTTTLTKKNAQTKYGGSGIGAPVTFYVTSDVPYDEAGEDKLVKDLAILPGDAEFAVHLGNIQDAATSFCPASTYTGVASMLKKSPVPLFMIPGAEDWAKCPNQEKSLQRWMESFVDFDNHFNHVMHVFRDKEHPEVFAFLHSGVLFFGLHLVSGPVADQDDWSKREMEMLTFYFGMSNLHKDQFRAIVMLGNTRPSPKQDGFFQAVFTSLKPINRPMAYIHANSGSGQIREYTPFEDQKAIFGIEIENGGTNPLLRITVGHGDRPFLVG
jgi:hypothetical protein